MKTKETILLTLLILSTACDKKENDRFVTIQGKQQHILDIGKGEPTVIFMHGRGDNLTTFSKIQNDIAKTTRTFSYDRAGLGKSDPIDSVRTFENMTKELDEILAIEDILPPYILVGHSLGCMFARYFYHVHKDKIAGLVLIDPGHEDQLQENLKSRNEKDRRYLDSLLHTIDPTWPKGLRDEIIYTEYNDGLMKKIIQPNEIPVTVLTSTMWNEQMEKDFLMTKKDMEIKVELVDNWTKSILRGRHVLTDKSGHWIHLREPGLVTEEITLVIDSVKSNWRQSKKSDL
jgi:hypothetical protein